MSDRSGGMMSSVDDLLLPENTARLSINFRHDKIGRATQRSGYTKIGSTVSAGQSCQGLFNCTFANGTVKTIAAFNGVNYAWDGAIWSNIGAGMSSAKVRYANLINYVFRVGGGTNTMSWNGAGSFGSAELTNAPSGSLIATFKNKVYIAGNSTYPDRLFFSSDPTTGLDITWTSTDWVDINPDDGDSLTAIAKTSTLLLLFKRGHMYRWNGTATDSDPVNNIGAASQETVQVVNGVAYFFGSKGIFSTGGDAPQEVGRPVKDWTDAIPSSQYSSMSSYADGNRFGLNCGNITKDGRTYTNVTLELDTMTNTWQVMLFHDALPAFATSRDSNGGEYVAAGSSTGDVFQMFKGNTDNGSPVNYEHESKRMFTDTKFSTKVIDDLAVYCVNGTGAVFEAIVEDTQPVRIGTISGPVSFFKSKNVRGRWMSFKLSGTNTQTPIEYRGFDILQGRELGMIH